jgi:predicted RNase H-like HicB family nuclease
MQGTKEGSGTKTVETFRRNIMRYHFRIHKEDNGYWAECCELDGCFTQADTLEELEGACQEALEVHLYTPVGEERVIAPPNAALDTESDVLAVAYPYAITK